MKKKFEHAPIVFTKNLNFKTINVDGQRYYVSADGSKKYISVTTALRCLSKKGIADWRKKIGEEAANKISKQASHTGTQVHNYIELYLKNVEEFPELIEEEHKLINNMFEKSLPVLNRIGKIYCQEQFLFSDVLQLAGRVDCIAEFDGIPSIIDFKTSQKPKVQKYTEGYFLQTTCYSFMLEELAHLKFKQLVIINIPQEGEPQVFIDQRKYYCERLKEVLNDSRRTEN